MISSILIDALARRAMQVYCASESNSTTLTVPVFRAAFTEELQRFDNCANAVHTPTPNTAPVRAKLISDPSAQGSLGKGVGQCTGGTAQSDAAEAYRLLRMIGSCPWDDDDGPLDTNTRRFIGEQMDKLRGQDEQAARAHYRVTGKMLFWLRDAKDKLCEKGIL
jgi:hypothetical protein